MSVPIIGQSDTTPKLPTAADFQRVLNDILSQMMPQFRAVGVDGFTINALGKILAALKFDGSQTMTETQLLISKVSKEAEEEMKLYMLRASVPDGTKVN